MNIVAKANDTNDILQTFRYLLLSSSVHGNRTAKLQWSCCRLLVIQEKSAVKKWKAQKAVSVVT